MEGRESAQQQSPFVTIFCEFSPQLSSGQGRGKFGVMALSLNFLHTKKAQPLL